MTEPFEAFPLIREGGLLKGTSVDDALDPFTAPRQGLGVREQERRIAAADLAEERLEGLG